MATVKDELAKVVAEYGVVRAWVAAHPVLAVGASLVAGVMVGLVIGWL